MYINKLAHFFILIYIFFDLDYTAALRLEDKSNCNRRQRSRLTSAVFSAVSVYIRNNWAMKHSAGSALINWVFQNRGRERLPTYWFYVMNNWRSVATNFIGQILLEPTYHILQQWADSPRIQNSKLWKYAFGAAAGNCGQ